MDYVLQRKGFPLYALYVLSRTLVRVTGERTVRSRDSCTAAL